MTASQYPMSTIHISMCLESSINLLSSPTISLHVRLDPLKMHYFHLDVHKFPLHTVQPRTFLIPPLCQTVKNRERILSLHPKIVQSTTTHLRKSPNHTCKSSCKAKKQEKSNELPGHEVCAYSLFARY